MNCRKTASLLSAYMDGELTGAESLRVREHLRHCEACRAEHESLQDTKVLIARLQVADPRPEFEQRLLESVRGMPVESWWRRRAAAAPALNGNGFRFRLAAAFAAGSVLLLAFSVRTTLTRSTTSASRISSRGVGMGHAPSLREQDIWFAHETFERPQPVSYRTAAEEQSIEPGPALRPLTAWDPAESAPAP